MEIKTCITDMSQLIQGTCEAVASFRHNPLMLETEEFVYELLLLEAKQELIEELKKAKLIRDGN